MIWSIYVFCVQRNSWFDSGFLGHYFFGPLCLAVICLVFFSWVCGFGNCFLILRFVGFTVDTVMALVTEAVWTFFSHISHMVTSNIEVDFPALVVFCDA